MADEIQLKTFEQLVEESRTRLADFSGSLKYSEEGRLLYAAHQKLLTQWAEAGNNPVFTGAVVEHVEPPSVPEGEQEPGGVLEE